MPSVYTKDKVHLFDVTQAQAQEIIRSCPNIIRARCEIDRRKRNGRIVERIVKTITIRLNLDRVKEWVEQAYSSETAALRTHYKVLFQCGLWCWSQKRLTEDGTFAKWAGEGVPFGPRVLKGLACG